MATRRRVRCPSPRVAAVARGIRRDRRAVEAAHTEGWSKGQAGGLANRLEMIKRTVHGRASFDFLRPRALHAACAAHPLHVHCIRALDAVIARVAHGTVNEAGGVRTCMCMQPLACAQVPVEPRHAGVDPARYARYAPISLMLMMIAMHQEGKP